MTDQTLLDTARALAGRLAPGDLDSTLAQITRAAVEVLPGVDHASITIRKSDDSLTTAAPTHDLLLRLDAAQYDLHEGPCYEAATDEKQVVSSDLRHDDRFPRYGVAAVAEGINAQSGVRLFDGTGGSGALNLYSAHVGAFDDVESLAALFAHQAGQAISYAQEIGNLAEAVRTRTMIGQAVGIVMERYGLTAERGFAFLQRLSSHRNLKLRLVAQEIVDGAATGALD
ncbi:MAG: GAF and ANTAR domain-containing protein [Nocardioidaceae bacterium]